jgi:L-lactate dehydrogenase complex protein LldF
MSGPEGSGSGDIRDRARLAVANERLRLALATATGRLLERSARAFDTLPDKQRAKGQARAARQHGLANLDVHLERFVANCVKNGMHVHFAADADEAARIVCELAKDQGSVIKSKSMATEEIHLNDALLARGIDVIETDLGEWVLQLAKEKPAHIVAPALHKTTAEFAGIIGQKIGRTLPEDPAALVTAARARLREEFIRGGVGVSGVNFGVAETGTLVLITNEGNGRLVTSGPRTHIALMGIEKVVPTLDGVVALLRVLARSGSGQKLTSYTSFISGPRRADEPDGPDEIHVVLLDNGRSRTLGTDQWESLLCIRCGACLNACPVYQRIGGHAYGSTYPGPIGLLATAMVRPDEESQAVMPHASSLCGACHEICPVQIDLPRMILSLRAQSVAAGRPPALERMLFWLAAFVFRRPWLYRAALGLGAWLSRVVGKSHLRSLGPKAWTRSRDLPMVARTPFRTWWAERKGRT